MCRDKRLEVGSTKCLLEKTAAWARYPHRWVSAPISGGRRACWAVRARAPVPVCIVLGTGRALAWIGGWAGLETEAQSKHSRVRKT